MTGWFTGGFTGLIVEPESVLPLLDLLIVSGVCTLGSGWGNKPGPWLIKKKKIKFVDSYRIFAVSLNGLCYVFNHGEGKTSSYNPNYNSLNIFKNDKLLSEFRAYADNDSIILYKCMLKASILYMENYEVDISQIVSMSSLSMLIFRKKFLNVKIPILNHKLDEFVRDSYYGGATDYYIKYAKKVYYYDVNSLYPYAMLKDLPLN